MSLCEGAAATVQWNCSKDNANPKKSIVENLTKMHRLQYYTLVVFTNFTINFEIYILKTYPVKSLNDVPPEKLLMSKTESRYLFAQISNGGFACPLLAPLAVL